MAKLTISLDADLALEVMMRVGASSPQDAVELIVRDYLATRAGTGDPHRGERFTGPAAPVEEG
ncbi:hypothetical protein [Kitasatospora sp. NPDC088134]|uniref:hypothetical protein n=1 Tax=Kitasatospora sp. NPDC088134 TaxID=3364071 RepID=UPI0037FD254A